MTPAKVAAYHRRMAQGCRDAAAIAWAGYNSGCDDAYLGYTGYREQAAEHDKMAEAVESLLPSNAALSRADVNPQPNKNSDSASA